MRLIHLARRTSTGRTRRSLAVGLVGLVAASSALAGCSDNRSDLAAEIDGTRITVDDFNAEVQKGLDDPIVGDLATKVGKAYRTQVLTQLVKQTLVDRLLKANDIMFTEADIVAFEKQNLGGLAPEEAQAQAAEGGQPYTRADLRRLATEFFLYAELGKKTAATPFDEQVAAAVAELKKAATTFDISVVYLASAAEQQDAVAQLQSGATTIAALGATLPANSDGTPQPQVQQGFDPAGLDSSAPELAAQIRAAKKGEFIPYDNGTAFLIVGVDAVTSKSDADLTSEAQTQVTATLNQAGQAEAAKQAKTYNIYVNPRFGELERPTESLPSVKGAQPATFTEPTTAPASAPAPPVAPAP